VGGNDEPDCKDRWIGGVDKGDAMSPGRQTSRRHDDQQQQQQLTGVSQTSASRRIVSACVE